MFRSLRDACRVLTVSTLFLGLGTQVDAAFLAQGSFETPVLNPSGFQYNPGTSAWTFSNGSGISRPSNNFSNKAAPDGVQYAFLQDNSDNANNVLEGVISQTITGVNAGDRLVIDFLALGRTNMFTTQGSNPFRVLIAGVEVLRVANLTMSGQFEGPSTAGFAAYSTAAYIATSSADLLLTFEGLGVELNGNVRNSDRTTFIDQVQVTATPGIVPAPEPSSFVLVGLFVACVATGSWFQRRRQVAAAA